MLKHLALITGSSTGIGRDLAFEAASKGCDVILVARTKDKLVNLAQEINKRFGVSAHVIPYDLSMSDAAEGLFAATEKANLKPDILINNAGFGALGSFSELSLAKMDEMIRLNALTLTKLTHLYLPYMLQKGWGRIMLVASTASFQACPNFAVYGATKAFVLSLGEAINSETKSKGVTVTTLCPGPTATEFHAQAGTNKLSLLQKSIGSSKAVARTGFRAMMRGKAVIVPGLMNKILAFSVRLMPRDITTHISKIFMSVGQ